MKKFFFSCLILLVFFNQGFSQVVTIGTQVWATKNLDVETFRNGDTIPQAKTAKEWAIAGQKKLPAWCYYENNLKNGKKYGKLYNWFAINDSRGLAPKGWHVPTDDDWTILEQYLDNDAPQKMKTKTGWSSWYDGQSCSLYSSKEISGNGSNTSGFSAMPGGFRNEHGLFSDIRNGGHWWSSSANTDYTFYTFALLSNDAYSGVMRNTLEGAYGLSVRCLKD